MRLALLRHAATAWSAAGRLQGRADPPLSAAGRATLAGRRLPAPFAGARAFCSPLARARETARLLGIAAPVIEPRIIEMDWGSFAGQSLAELRSEHGGVLAANEARGLDFQPPGGESPRAVRDRLQPWIAELASSGEDAVAVTHKGVIRVLLAEAYGWTMQGPMPMRPDWTCLHVLELGSGGAIRRATLNLPLERP